MIDTPQSIAENRNTTTTQRYIFAPAKPLILPSGAVAWSNWQQQTENAVLSPTDNDTYRNISMRFEDIPEVKRVVYQGNRIYVVTCEEQYDPELMHRLLTVESKLLDRRSDLIVEYVGCDFVAPDAPFGACHTSAAYIGNVSED